jgi:hypothetical protein
VAIGLSHLDLINFQIININFNNATDLDFYLQASFNIIPYMDVVTILTYGNISRLFRKIGFSLIGCILLLAYKFALFSGSRNYKFVGLSLWIGLFVQPLLTLDE